MSPWTDAAKEQDRLNRSLLNRDATRNPADTAFLPVDTGLSTTKNQAAFAAGHPGASAAVVLAAVVSAAGVSAVAVLPAGAVPVVVDRAGKYALIIPSRLVNAMTRPWATTGPDKMPCKVVYLPRTPSISTTALIEKIHTTKPQ